jgi:hypothetical protein
MDVIPITLFINLYLISTMRRLFHLAWWKIGLLWLTYGAAGAYAQASLPQDMLNGTIMYVPTYLTLGLITALLWCRDKALGRIFARVFVVWTASLVFRTIDMDICPRISFGSHFLWHILNAWVLWRLLVALVAYRRG